MHDQNFWKTPKKNEKLTESSLVQKLKDLKTKILYSSCMLNANDVHHHFVALYKEAKNDSDKKMICESALDYCNEKWNNSSNPNIFSKSTEISKVISQISAYWKDEKEQLNIPIRPFSLKNNLQSQ